MPHLPGNLYIYYSMQEEECTAMTALKKKGSTGAVFVTLLFIYSSIYIARVNMSVASPFMLSEGTATVSQIGILGSVFSIVYASGRLFTGGICDKYIPYIILAAGVSVTGLANILFSAAPSYPVMLVMWALNAFGQSLLWGNVLRVMAATYEGKDLKKKTALMAATVSIGTIIGYILSTLLINTAGWRMAFVIPGIICIAAGICAVMVLRNIKAETSIASGKVNVFKLIEKKDIFGKFIPAFLHGLIKDNVSFWLPTILAMKYLVSGEITGLMIIIVPAIGMAGRMLYPSLLGILKDDEDLITLICFAAGALCSVLLIFTNTSGLIATVLLGIIYAATSMINTTFLSIYPIKFAQKGCSATISGIMDFLSYTAAAAGSALYGVLAEKYGYDSLYICWSVFAVLGIVLLAASRKKAQEA